METLAARPRDVVYFELSPLFAIPGWYCMFVDEGRCMGPFLDRRSVVRAADIERERVSPNVLSIVPEKPAVGQVLPAVDISRDRKRNRNRPSYSTPVFTKQALN